MFMFSESLERSYFFFLTTNWLTEVVGFLLKKKHYLKLKSFNSMFIALEILNVCKFDRLKHFA